MALPEDVTSASWAGRTWWPRRWPGEATSSCWPWTARRSGHGLARRLRRVDVEVEEVGPGGLAAAAAAADLVLLEADAIGPDGLRRLPGEPTPRPRSAYCAEVPVWLVGGVGRLLPERLWRSVVTRLAEAGEPWEVDHDVVPLLAGLGAVRAPGPEPVADGLRRLDCPVAPELLRTSPF